MSGDLARELRPGSVTKILDRTINPGDSLLRWAWSQGRKNLPLDDPKRRAGLEVHTVLEKLVAGEVVNVRDYSPGARAGVEGVLAWWRDTRPQIVAVETKVADEELWISGRIDYARWCPRCEVCEPWDDRGVILGDFKNLSGSHSSKGSRGARAHIQVGGAYRRMWEADDSRPRVCACEIVDLIPDVAPMYEVVPAMADEGDFLRAVAHAEGLATIETRIASRRGALAARTPQDAPPF